jgi:UDP-GlcNAc:undecaprenyl-phosphate/decaprenyl-phosphate GlcNAc-1-phosphate transferase
MRTYILILITASVLSYFFTLWISRLAGERGWARREEDPTVGEGVPRLGGAAVFAGMVLAIGASLLVQNMVTDRVLAAGRLGVALAIACSAVFLIGLYDDLRGARPWQKLAVQAGAAGLLYGAGFRIEIVSNPFTHAPTALGWLALPITVLWLVAISNAFNLIDGLDGLAAGVGMFAGVSLFLLAALVSNVFVAAVAAAIAGALLGFLPHNFHPARIYLGDSGSLTAGLALAALSTMSAQKGPVMVAVAIPLLVFGLPLLEVGVTTTRRLLSGHPLFSRDEDHLHHRLIKIGVAKDVALFLLYGLAAVFALSSILLVNYSGSVVPLIAVLCGAFAWIVVGQMRYPEFTELDAHIRTVVSSQPAVLRNQIAIRKTTQALERAASAPELWTCLTGLLDQLGFAEARCEMRGIHGGAAHEFDWRSATPRRGKPLPIAAAGDALWTVEIPLAGNGRMQGVVRLGHVFDRRGPLFRMPSLVELISDNFATALVTCSQPEHEVLPAASPTQIPAALKAAAGLQR